MHTYLDSSGEPFLNEEPGTALILVRPSGNQLREARGDLFLSVLVSVFLIYALRNTITGLPAILGAMFISAIPLWSLLDYYKTKRRTAFLESYSFPPAVREKVKEEYPHLTQQQLTWVMEGLRQYFHLCNAAPKENLSMPSRAVDVAWHAFLLYTRIYADFCDGALGRFRHHSPAGENTATKFTDGLKTSWRAACRWEGIDCKRPDRLPFLFAIDIALAIPDGFAHDLENNYAADEDIESSDGSGCGGCDGCG